jgi:hypothetical protein
MVRHKRDQLLPRVGLGEATAHCALVSGIGQLPHNNRQPAGDLRRRGGYPVRRRGRGGEALAVTAAAERARLAKAQADKVELANARARGALLDCRGGRGRVVGGASDRARWYARGAKPVGAKASAPDGA